MKEYLESLGWSVESARERVASCRKYQAQYRVSGWASARTYRLINAGLYLKYRQYVTILSS